MTRLSRRRYAPTTPAWSIEPFALLRDALSWDPFETSNYATASVQTPRFDIKETSESYVLKADLPGIAEKDLSVKVVDNRLSVEGTRETEDTKEGEKYHTIERHFGSFHRSFDLPQSVDAESVEATLKEGVLTLTLPKKVEVQPRTIEVKRA